MATVLQFPGTPTKHTPKQPRRSVGYPKAVTLVCDDGELLVDPATHEAQQVAPHCFPRSGEPAVFEHGGEVVLDLGDCSSARTMLRFTPEAAEEWARALITVAQAAKRNKQGEQA